MISLTSHSLAGQDRIQDLVAGLILRLVQLDLLLHLVKIPYFFLRIDAVPQNCNLMFEIMIFLIDKIHTLPRGLIIRILNLKNILHGLQFHLLLCLVQHNGIKIKNNNPGKIHNGSKQQDFRCVPGGKRRPLKHKADITHEIHRADDQYLPKKCMSM